MPHTHHHSHGALKDLNDQSPKFAIHGRPAQPSTVTWHIIAFCLLEDETSQFVSLLLVVSGVVAPSRSEGLDDLCLHATGLLGSGSS